MNNEKLETISEDVLDAVSGGGRGHGGHRVSLGGIVGGVIDGAFDLVGGVVGGALRGLGGLLSGLGGLLGGHRH